jgi:cytochrome P450
VQASRTPIPVISSSLSTARAKGAISFGAGLARVEAHEAFRVLLSWFPTMRLASVPIEWRPNLGLRGLTRLMVVPAP